MRFLSVVLLFLFVLAISACDEKQTPQEVTTTDKIDARDTLSIAKPTNLKPKIGLTPQAREGVANWPLYRDLSVVIDSLQIPTLGVLKNKIQKFDNLYEAKAEAEEAEVQVTPKETLSNAIQARLITIETKVKVLKNEAFLNNPNSETLSKQIGDLHNAYQDLNLQLNEAFNTNFRDLLEEIKLENEEPDGDGEEKEILED
ncbi:hypothetical protein [Dokdonia donghaensis]|uniref:Lipoprotein n=1 Tax=Dokdonia donghaensis DSW-1 TaxID=1300343 RepID=A0A0A2H2Z8_9FLAO|nr:hypothetical protein [Dokdonia donghaensis]ANH59672.1 hypothetical protein I597_0743 [Dokdonia donghaensis DSW-1]KGO07025.1 hypothetical protein NV36_09355 [Dokdonia donghaensis DSW-1]